MKILGGHIYTVTGGEGGDRLPGHILSAKVYYRPPPQLLVPDFNVNTTQNTNLSINRKYLHFKLFRGSDYPNSMHKLETLFDSVSSSFTPMFRLSHYQSGTENLPHNMLRRLSNHSAVACFKYNFHCNLR